MILGWIMIRLWCDFGLDNDKAMVWFGAIIRLWCDFGLDNDKAML